jgi:hypothetical protein
MIDLNQLFSSCYHMHVARHYSSPINLQTFIYPAILPAIQQYLPVFISYKQVYPAGYSKCYKIKFFLIMKLILSTHTLNIA